MEVRFPERPTDRLALAVLQGATPHTNHIVRSRKVTVMGNAREVLVELCRQKLWEPLLGNNEPVADADIEAYVDLMLVLYSAFYFRTCPPDMANDSYCADLLRRWGVSDLMFPH